MQLSKDFDVKSNAVDLQMPTAANNSVSATGFWVWPDGPKHASVCLWHAALYGERLVPSRRPSAGRKGGDHLGKSQSLTQRGKEPLSKQDAKMQHCGFAIGLSLQPSDLIQLFKAQRLELNICDNTNVLKSCELPVGEDESFTFYYNSVYVLSS